MLATSLFRTTNLIHPMRDVVATARELVVRVMDVVVVIIVHKTVEKDIRRTEKYRRAIARLETAV